MPPRRTLTRPRRTKPRRTQPRTASPRTLRRARARRSRPKKDDAAKKDESKSDAPTDQPKGNDGAEALRVTGTNRDDIPARRAQRLRPADRPDTRNGRSFMANPTVEKLKVLGMRDGEKAAVGLLVVLCLVFIAKAITHETINTTPDELKKAAAAALQNIDRPQKDDDIVSKLEAQSIKEVGFEKVVDARLSTKQDATLFATDNSWVSPEPGAAREMPTLIAVAKLYAHSGRGGLVMVNRDENGDLTYVTHKDTPKPKRRKVKRPPGGGMTGRGTQKKKKRKADACSAAGGQEAGA